MCTLRLESRLLKKKEPSKRERRIKRYLITSKTLIGLERSMLKETIRGEKKSRKKRGSEAESQYLTQVFGANVFDGPKVNESIIGKERSWMDNRRGGPRLSKRCW